MFTLYLEAAGVEISQRLATALHYGIKSDTLFFNRGVSERDLEAYVYLYPKINGALLRRIERPELPLNYIDNLRKALKDFNSTPPMGTHTVMPCNETYLKKKSPGTELHKNPDPKVSDLETQDYHRKNSNEV